MSSSIPIQGTRTGGNARPSQMQRVARFLTEFLFRRLKGQFILQASLILLLAGILTLAGATSLSRSTNDLSTINTGSIISVDAAQAITQHIEAIDASSADFLATAGLNYITSCFINGNYSPQLYSVHNCDAHNIDAETVLANQQLFIAMHNVSYPGERTAVERISVGMESYLEDIHLMQVDYGLASSKTDPQDPTLQQAYKAYLDASKILHGQISLTTLGASQIPLDIESNLPACKINDSILTPDQWTRGSLTQALDCLSNINYTHLGQAYTDASNFLSGATLLILLLSILFCGLLLFANLRMTTTTRRVLNPGLAAAVLIALILSISSVSLLGGLTGQSSQGASQDGAFRQMVQDDYLSVYDAALLQRYATDANADESRWLIAQEFNDQANIQHWQDDWNSNVQQINTLMHNAHTNQTWETEIQPLADMDSTWHDYYSIDSEIRSAVQNHSRPHPLLDAEEISTWQSNWAFSGFSDAVSRLSQANRDQYNQTFGNTNQALSMYFFLDLILFPLAGLLALWGITVRLKDF